MEELSLNRQGGVVERRQHRRVATNLYITYAIEGSEAEAGVFLTKNVSGGGILFESFKEIPVGTVFDLSLHLPTSADPLRAKGRVVRSEKIRDYGRYDIGLSLTEVSDQERRELIKYLVSITFTPADYEALFCGEPPLETLLFEDAQPT